MSEKKTLKNLAASLGSSSGEFVAAAIELSKCGISAKEAARTLDTVMKSITTSDTYVMRCGRCGSTDLGRPINCYSDYETYKCYRCGFSDKMPELKSVEWSNKLETNPVEDVLRAKQIISRDRYVHLSAKTENNATLGKPLIVDLWKARE